LYLRPFLKKTLKIDGDIYEQKTNEYKKRQQEIVSLMATHVNADKVSLITVKTVLDLAKRAKKIYESSKVDEKRQILNFLFSNLEMKDKKVIITLLEPFDKLVAVPKYSKCRETWDGLRTFPWLEFGILLEELIPFAA
jgi:hypothetical protein